MARHPDPKLDYISKIYPPQDTLLTEITAALKSINMSIQIGSQEGRMLQVLMALHGTRTIVEIGTLAGYSAIWMARGLPEGGHLYTINKDAEHIKLAKDFFARSDVGRKITMLEGDALEMLPELDTKGPFDMVFIDADKNNYLGYLDWSEKNIRKGGLIIADNTFLHDAIYKESCPEGTAPTTWNNMQIFNKRLADLSRYNSTIIPTQEGMTIALKLF